MTFWAWFLIVYVASSVIILALFLHFKNSKSKEYDDLQDEAWPFNSDSFVLQSSIIPIVNTIIAIALIIGAIHDILKRK